MFMSVQWLGIEVWYVIVFRFPLFRFPLPRPHLDQILVILPAILSTSDVKSNTDTHEMPKRLQSIKLYAIVSRFPFSSS